MEYPEKRYYKLNRLLLTFSGLWPYQNARNALILRILSSFVILSSLFVQVTDAVTSEITIDYLFEMIPIFMIVANTLIHLHMRSMHIDKLKELFDRMRNDWALQKTDNEIKIMHDYAGTSRLLSFYFTFYMFGIIAAYMLYLYKPDILDIVSPMNESRPRKQYFKVQYFVSEEQYISLIRLHIFVCTFFVLMLMLAFTALFVAVTQHVCGMFELLGYRAERLFCVTENMTERNLGHRTKIIYKNTAVFLRLHQNVIQFVFLFDINVQFLRLATCVLCLASNITDIRYFNHTIGSEVYLSHFVILHNVHGLFYFARYVGLIEYVHTLPFLLDLIGVVVMLSITLMQVFSISGNVEQTFRSIIFACSHIIYISLYNYFSQQVTDKSSNICDRVYNSAWYDALVAQQKPLLLIMKQCCQPLVLTACNFYVMSLPNLGRILQTTVSYSMFIRKV